MKTLLLHPYVLVLVGGGLGSLLRYWTGRLIPAAWAGLNFPTAILLVNGIASAILGLVMGWVLSRPSADESLRLLVGMGFCGGLSTFSSFSYDTLALLQSGRWVAALLNITLNLIVCLVASAVGLGVGQKL